MQKGGLKILNKISEKVIENGSVLATYDAITEDGKATTVQRFVKGANRSWMDKIRKKSQKKKTITKAQAQKAFTDFYSSLSASKLTRGPNKGEPRYKNVRGLNRAMTHDVTYTDAPVIDDERYVKHPDRYDFQGVDTGKEITLSPSQKQALRKARGALKRSRSRSHSKSRSRKNRKSRSPGRK